MKAEALKANTLYTYAIDHYGDGFTYVDVKRDLGWTRSTFSKIKRYLNLHLGNIGDHAALVGAKQGGYPGYVKGGQRPWIYDLAVSYEDFAEYVSRANKISASILEPPLAIIRGRLTKIDGRSLEARALRQALKSIMRAYEDLRELDSIE